MKPSTKRLCRGDCKDAFLDSDSRQFRISSIEFVMEADRLHLKPFLAFANSEEADCFT
jgi:hypothetical protein